MTAAALASSRPRADRWPGDSVAGRPDPSALVLAVDRRPLVRSGLARLAAGALGAPTAAAADLAEVASVTRSHGSDLRVLLIGVPRGMDAPSAVADASRFGVPVICALDEGDDDSARAAMASGAAGYLIVERADAQTLRAAVHAAEAGEPTADGGGDRPPQLIRRAVITERSIEVLGSLADGLHDREIAAELGISTSSVRKHIASAQIRLQARTRTQAVAMAAREGLL